MIVLFKNFNCMLGFGIRVRVKCVENFVYSKNCEVVEYWYWCKIDRVYYVFI